MNSDMVIICLDVILDVVLCYLCLCGELLEGIDDLYVVDKYNCFLGVFLLIILLINLLDKIVCDLMDEECELILILMDESDVV